MKIVFLAVVVTALVASSTSFPIHDPSHRRLLLLPSHDDARDHAISGLHYPEEEEDRVLRDQLPADLSICDEYFFGRPANLPEGTTYPFCVNGGL